MTLNDRVAWATNKAFTGKIGPLNGIVLIYLATKSDKLGKATPTQPEIAEACGICDRQARRCVRSLHDLELIVMTTLNRAFSGKASTYHLAYRPGWKNQIQEFENSYHDR